MAVKIVIDTNIWISSLLNPHGFPAKLRESFKEGVFNVVISETMLEELAEVLNRPRIKNKYGISEKDIKKLLILIEERSEHVLITGNINICRDKIAIDPIISLKFSIANSRKSGSSISSMRN